MVMSANIQVTEPGSPATPVSRPGGRSARVRAAVHHAVEELIAEASLSGTSTETITLPMVAARAGVHATTVYRRWGTLGDLLSEVATHRFSGDIVVPDTGTLRSDLERWAADVATDLSDPDVLALMRATIGAAGVDGSCACVEDRNAQLAAMLERERLRGGTPPDVKQLADQLLGPLYYRAVFTFEPPERAWASGLVAALLG
jgi:AcrR family transcriptional regulator